MESWVLKASACLTCPGARAVKKGRAGAGGVTFLGICMEREIGVATRTVPWAGHELTTSTEPLCEVITSR